MRKIITSPYAVTTLVSMLYAIILGSQWINVDLYSPFFGCSLPNKLSIQGVCDFFTITDMGRYCSIGHDIAQNGYSGLVQNVGMFSIWPPAPFLNFTLAEKIFGTEASIFPFFASYMYGVWLLAFIVIGHLASKRLGMLGYMFPLLILSLPELSRFMLVVGLYNGDCYGAALFIIPFAFLLFAKKPSSLACFFAGIALGLSAYYRSFSEAIIVIMLLGLFACWGYIAIREYLKFGSKFTDTLKREYTNSRYIFLTLLIAVLITLPWRVFIFKYDHRLSWTKNVGIEINSSWFDPKTTDQWGIDGGYSLACKFAPDVCAKIHERGIYNVSMGEKRREMLKIIISHPVKWFSIKSRMFAEQWMHAYNNQKSVMLNVLRCLFIIPFTLYPIYICFSFLFAKGAYDVRRTVLLGANLAMTVLMLLLVHIEQRYLYMYKILAILYLLDLAIVVYESQFAAFILQLRNSKLTLFKFISSSS